MVADVGHLKEILVQSGLSQIFLKKRLVGPGAAGSHDDPVKPLFHDGLAHPVLAVGGAGKQDIFGPNHIRQAPGIGGHIGHIHYAGDIDAAMADDHTDPRFFGGDLPGLGKGLFRDQAPPGRGQKLAYLSGSGRGLGNRFRDVLGAVENAGHIDSGSIGDQGIDFLTGGKAEGVQIQAQFPGQRNAFLVGFKTYGQNDQIKDLNLKPIGLIEILYLELLSQGLFNHPGNHGSYVTNPVFGFGPFIILIKALTLGPDVDKKYSGRYIRKMLLGDDGLFGSNHAAD